MSSKTWWTSYRPEPERPVSSAVKCSAGDGPHSSLPLKSFLCIPLLMLPPALAISDAPLQSIVTPCILECCNVCPCPLDRPPDSHRASQEEEKAVQSSCCWPARFVHERLSRHSKKMCPATHRLNEELLASIPVMACILEDVHAVAHGTNLACGLCAIIYK